MKKIIKRVVDASERLLFGATAEEAVARQIALIDRRVEAFARMLDALEQDDDPQDDDPQDDDPQDDDPQETTGNEREDVGA